MRLDTPTMLKGLRWVQDRQPVKLGPEWTMNGPATVTRRRLERAELIERCDNSRRTDTSPLTHFQATDKGRQLLWDNRA